MSPHPMALSLHGNPVHFYTGGRPWREGARTLILLHGAGHDHSVWQHQARALAEAGLNVLAPDLPGHGRSGGSPLSSIAALADWVEALADALGLQQIVLAGHSMGALVALETASRLGPRVTALALLGCALPMPVAPVLLEAALKDRPHAHAMINQWSFAPRRRLTASPIPGFDLVNANLRLMERQAPGVLHADLRACDSYLDGPAAARRIACPTLLLCGERDQMTPGPASQALREALASVPGGARMMLLSGAGHAMMSEAPIPVIDALRGLVKETQG